MLPPEIIDCILSLLQRDRAALKACAAAHPLLSSLAERHLAVHIVVSTSTQSGLDAFLVPHLSRYLSKRPWIAEYIRSIAIHGHLALNVMAFAQLSTILPLIPRAERLSLHHILWSDVPENFRSAVLDFVRSPHMNELDLRHSSCFPLSILHNSPNIKNLRLLSSDCICTSPAEAISLESLSLVGPSSPRLMAWAGLRVNHLSSLHCDVLPQLGCILDIFSESLRNLTLRLGSSFTTTYCKSGSHIKKATRHLDRFPFDLSALARLEILTIHAIMRGPSEIEPFCRTRWCVSPLPAISRLVGTAGPAPQSVVLNLDCVGGVRHLRGDMEWKPLVHLCDDLYPGRVDLYLRPLVGSHEYFPEVVESLSKNEAFSRLMEHGSLTIKPSTPDFPY